MFLDKPPEGAFLAVSLVDLYRFITATLFKSCVVLN